MLRATHAPPPPPRRHATRCAAAMLPIVDSLPTMPPNLISSRRARRRACPHAGFMMLNARYTVVVKKPLRGRPARRGARRAATPAP